MQYFDTANRVAKKEIPFYENYEFFLRTLAEKTEKIPTGFIVKTGLTLAELFLEHSNSMKKEHPFFLLVFKENINTILQNKNFDVQWVITPNFSRFDFKSTSNTLKKTE